MASQSLSEQIIAGLDHVPELYYRLALVVGLPDTGKTRALREVGEEVGAPHVNLGVELSQRLLDVSAQQRPRQVGQILEGIVEKAGAVILLDNLEILFERTLEQDPLRLLKGLSRNRTVVATWNGTVDNGSLVYGDHGHPEYRSYPAAELAGLLVVTREAS
jgi:ATPase family associated with various cellular activities (AAA)